MKYRESNIQTYSNNNFRGADFPRKCQRGRTKVYFIVANKKVKQEHGELANFFNQKSFYNCNNVFCHKLEAWNYTSVT